jgi:hypothetical protein
MDSPKGSEEALKLIAERLRDWTDGGRAWGGLNGGRAGHDRLTIAQLQSCGPLCCLRGPCSLCSRDDIESRARGGEVESMIIVASGMKQINGLRGAISNGITVSFHCQKCLLGSLIMPNVKEMVFLCFALLTL